MTKPGRISLPLILAMRVGAFGCATVGGGHARRMRLAEVDWADGRGAYCPRTPVGSRVLRFTRWGRVGRLGIGLACRCRIFAVRSCCGGDFEDRLDGGRIGRHRRGPEPGALLSP